MATTSNSPAAGAPEGTQFTSDRLDSGQASLETAGVMFRAAENLVLDVQKVLREDGDVAAIRAIAVRELGDVICLMIEGANRVKVAAHDFRATDVRNASAGKAVRS